MCNWIYDWLTSLTWAACSRARTNDLVSSLWLIASLYAAARRVWILKDTASILIDWLIEWVAIRIQICYPLHYGANPVFPKAASFSDPHQWRTSSGSTGDKSRRLALTVNVQVCCGESWGEGSHADLLFISDKYCSGGNVSSATKHTPSWHIFRSTPSEAQSQFLTRKWRRHESSTDHTS